MRNCRKTKKTAVLCLLAAAICAIFAGCRADGEAITSYDQLGKPGTRIGVMSDLIEYEMLKKDFPDAEIIAYNDSPLAYDDVANGRLDAYVYARREMEIAIENGTEGVRILKDDYNENRVAVGISPASGIPDLRRKINQFIAQAKEDGTLDDMYRRWVVEVNEEMPEITRGSAVPPPCRHHRHGNALLVLRRNGAQRI